MSTGAYEIIVKASGTVLGGVVLYLLQAGVRVAFQLRDDVRDLKNNHVPHLQEAVEELRGAINELAKKFH